VIFREVALKGAFLVEPATVEDERGFFARTWCFREFEAQGLEMAIAQCSISFNRMEGTLRGMHYQEAPHKEAKLVRCTMGSIYDVIIDLRAESPTYKQYVAEILSAENRKMLYIPEGFAHGFLTLENCTEVFYQISTFHAPEYARGVRWNDPAFGIPWPSEVRVISERDNNYPDFEG
jgi:dTDP-4-dehydrorhamnose 3,5-epimerase